MEQTYFMNMAYISIFIPGTAIRFSVHRYTQDDSATSSRYECMNITLLQLMTSIYDRKSFSFWLSHGKVIYEQENVFHSVC